MIFFDIDISPLVPEEYVGYRPIIAEALAFFLQRLTRCRQQEIVAE